MERSSAGAGKSSARDRRADITGPPLGHVSPQQQLLDFASPALLLPLHLMQGEVTAFFAHKPCRQGVKLLASAGQLSDGGHVRHGWQWDSDSGSQNGLLHDQDHRMNKAASELATKESALATIFGLQPCKIKQSHIEEK
jgi:hypothetical protein